MSLYFVESTVFTRRVTSLGLESALRALQDELLKDPLVGDTDAGTGGLRKVRMPDPSRRKGKRGGARVHYLYLAAHDVIYLLFVHGKDDQETLSAAQKKNLKAMADAIKAAWH